MGKINYGRVIIGGLLAGLVITIGEAILNLAILGDEWQMFVEQHDLPEPNTATNVLWLIWNFVMGIAMVLFYALIRPRCGAGPKTAVWTGVFVWFLVSFMCFGAIGVSFAMPSSLIVIGLLWGLVEFILAALAGGWFYKEAEA
jgi:hypothetical protein